MNIHIIKNLVHIFITGPILLYVGLLKPNSKKFYYLLLALALAIVAVFVYRKATRTIKPWNIVHLFFIATTLLGVSTLKLSGQKVPNILYFVLAGMGFVAVIYHIMSIVRAMGR